MSALEQSASGHGAYRRRETVTLNGDVVLLRQPLVATRLNDSAKRVFEALEVESYRTPAGVAAETGVDETAVANIFERLHERSILEWRPGYDPSFNPSVSVVVTVRNDRRNLERCLDALDALSYPQYEVVVVDDGSTDGTRAAAASHRLARTGRLRVVDVGSPSEPLGIGASRNRGVAAAVNDVVAFTDADCRPTEDWLAELVPCLAVHDIVGGRIRPAGSGAGSAYEGVTSSLDMGGEAGRVDPGGRTPYLATANLVGRRTVFETVPFPERNVAEDVGFCWEALDAGYGLVYTPTGVVEHDYRDSLRGVTARRADYGASEALLGREFDAAADGPRVTVPADALLVAGCAIIALTMTGIASMFAGALTAVTAAVGLLGRVGTSMGQYRRLGSLVSSGDLLRSRRRQVVSTTYEIAREITRYYSVPAALGALIVGAWSPVLGFVLLSVVGTTVAVPLLVEYTVHSPETSLAGYTAYYLADHLGYQAGVYRGAVTYRTVEHLLPHRRFQLSGLGLGRLSDGRRGSTASSSNSAVRRNQL